MYCKLVTALAVTLFLAISNQAAASSLTGKVVGVPDGDTSVVLDSSKITNRIRLSGIDAPEKAQPFGQRSKQHLSYLVFAKQVEIQAGKTDKYGRTVGKVLIHGVDANLEQVKTGFAWHYKQYAVDQLVAVRALYASAEESARRTRSGLWLDPKPMRLGNGDMAERMNPRSPVLLRAARVVMRGFALAKKGGITAWHRTGKSGTSNARRYATRPNPLRRNILGLDASAQEHQQNSKKLAFTHLQMTHFQPREKLYWPVQGPHLFRIEIAHYRYRLLTI